VKIGEGEGHALRKCINNILLSVLYFYPILIKFGKVEDQDNWLNEWEFRENRLSESHILLREVNGFLSVLATFTVRIV
jgi:hypothetical protein